MALFKPRKVIQRTVAEEIDQRMREIKQLFPEAKMTLVIRSPSLEGPLIFTNDQPEDAIAAIQSMSTRPNAVVVAE